MVVRDVHTYISSFVRRNSSCQTRFDLKLLTNQPFAGKEFDVSVVVLLCNNGKFIYIQRTDALWDTPETTVEKEETQGARGNTTDTQSRH